MRQWLVPAVVVLLGLASGGCVAPMKDIEPTLTAAAAVRGLTSTPRPPATAQPAATPVPYATADLHLPAAPTVIDPVCPNPYLDRDLPSPEPATPTPEAASAASPTGTALPRAVPTPVRVGPVGNVPPPPLFQPAPLVRELDLENQLSEALGPDGGSFAVFAKRLSDGRGAAVNANQVFYAASTFKVSVMYEAFRQRSLGLLDFGEQYRITDYYAGFNVGPAVLAACEVTSIGDALAAMMSVSDNIAAVFLADRVGSRNINADFAALGMGSTLIAADMPVTAMDMGVLLEAIFRAHGLTQQDARDMLALMGTETLSDRIPAGLPPGTAVAHKTGNYANATNDVGIVFAPSGPYVIVLLSEWGWGQDAAEREAELSRIVYDYFENGGRTPPAMPRP